MPSIPRSLPFPLSDIVDPPDRVVSEWSITANARTFGAAAATGALTLSGTANATGGGSGGRVVSDWTAGVAAKTFGAAAATGSITIVGFPPASYTGNIPGALGRIVVSGTATAFGFVPGTGDAFGYVIIGGVKREVVALSVIIDGVKRPVVGVSVIIDGVKHPLV